MCIVISCLLCPFDLQYGLVSKDIPGICMFFGSVGVKMHDIARIGMVVTLVCKDGSFVISVSWSPRRVVFGGVV